MMRLYVYTEMILLVLIKNAEQIGDHHILQLTEFLAIALNTFVVISAIHEHRPYDKAIAIALILTMVGDVFLTLLNSYYEVGVFFFCAVQTVYTTQVRVTLRSIVLRFVMILLIIFFSSRKTLLVFLAAYSFSNLFVTCIDSLLEKKDPLFCSGMILFLLCDLCVGLHNLLHNGIFYSVSSWLMWFFYLPSQVMLTLYCRQKKS